MSKSTPEQSIPIKQLFESWEDRREQEEANDPQRAVVRDFYNIRNEALRQRMDICWESKSPIETEGAVFKKVFLDFIPRSEDEVDVPPIGRIHLYQVDGERVLDTVFTIHNTLESVREEVDITEFRLYTQPITKTEERNAKLRKLSGVFAVIKDRQSRKTR